MVDIPNTNITYLYDDEILYNEKEKSHTNDTNETNESKSTNDDMKKIIDKIIDKTNNQSLNNGWNKRNELFIISIQLNCQNYKKMHELSAIKYSFIFKIMKIGLIIISTLLSVLTTYPNDQCGITMSIIRFFLTYIVTLISILMHFLNYSHLIEGHKNAAYEFLKIHHDIKQQMCLYKRDRYIAFKYISKIIKQYDTLIMTSPIIPQYILNKCKTEIEKCSEDINDIVKTISTVDIDIIDNDNKDIYFKSKQVNKNTQKNMNYVRSPVSQHRSEHNYIKGPVLYRAEASGDPVLDNPDEPVNSNHISILNNDQGLLGHDSDTTHDNLQRNFNHNQSFIIQDNLNSRNNYNGYNDRQDRDGYSNNIKFNITKREDNTYDHVLYRSEQTRDPLLINGDIDDDEINKCNSDQIKELRLKFFKANSSYEYLRFLRNEME